MDLKSKLIALREAYNLGLMTKDDYDQYRLRELDIDNTKMEDTDNSTFFSIDNTKMKDTDNSKNEWINWIEEAISKQHIKYYEYKHFYNIERIGLGGFGGVCRAKWKNSRIHLALKSFNKTNFADTTKEIVKEVIINNRFRLIIYYTF